MSPVEIEQAISELAESEFEAENFAFAFLEAFGNKATTIKRLKSGNTNSSDLEGGVLQRNNIHIAVCSAGKVGETLARLRESPATAKGKVRFIVATDGADFEAEDLGSDEPPVVCPFASFPDYFGFFLPLAGITTVRQIRESSFDIKATGRLNRLYIELLKHNPDWGTAERRHDMNHFMARLIFCFFAEDTNIFNGDNLFTATIEQMSDASNTHTVISEIFRAMDTPINKRPDANLRRWADGFPYVNGGLFAGNTDVPHFSPVARRYLLHVGHLDWKQINPDIFGSMIQAIESEDEREALGLHYTSVPNILKVLNPLFLDDLRLEQAKCLGNARKLLNLRKRIANIRVFDPACGSGNFLVIAYKQMRAIEAEINEQRDEAKRRSEISLKNFRGIEIRDFPAEIARLALILAEYQCNVRYCGPEMAFTEFLPLDKQNWITCGNALHIDWEGVCPPVGKTVQLHGEDLLSKPTDQAEINFETEGGETYICSNPPYLGSTWQSKEQKADLESVFANSAKNWKSLDYVAGWFFKAARYAKKNDANRVATAFVATNSICQGQQVGILWPLIFETGHSITFAYTSFKWANLARHNAGVTVAIVGLAKNGSKKLFDTDQNGKTVAKEAENINAYLVAGTNTIVKKASKPLGELPEMVSGNKPTDGGNLLLTKAQLIGLGLGKEQREKFIHRIYGSDEFINGLLRYCLWIQDQFAEEASAIEPIHRRIEAVENMRLSSRKPQTVELAATPHKFEYINQSGNETIIVISATSSENRDYLPCGVLPQGTIISNSAFALYDAPLWNLALIASRLHLIWIKTICGQLETRIRYSNTLGWNTFPVPQLTANNKAELTRCAEEILLAREAHFPATIAELYKKMPENLRCAHAHNDEVLERIYIGRRFKNDTERLEKLFALYTKMTTPEKSKAPKTKQARKI